jgi:hypothetical protein
MLVYGAARLLADLAALGFMAELHTVPAGPEFVIIRKYEVEVGRFAGRVIDLGFQATPDFPKTVASAIHVRAAPQLFEVKDNIPNVRNVQPSVLGDEWRYWSKNFGWTEERTARRLMTQVNSVFHDA